MARRRSLNRRWSRRSSNTLNDLNQDSEVLETDNVGWWKDNQVAATLRPSAQNSFVETTGSTLVANSQVDDSELQDSWWDNLSRTNLQLSRRFSRRRSAFAESHQEKSVGSDDNDDVSTKKRKIERESRTRSTGAKDSFGKISDESIVARSEPINVGKTRKISESPPISDAELLQRRTSRGRHSRSFADVEGANVSGNTSDWVGARPKSIGKPGKTLSSTAYDDVLASESLRMNFGENLSRISGSLGTNRSSAKSRTAYANVSTVSQNEASATSGKNVEPDKIGFTRIVSDGQREDISRVPRTLRMSSDESEIDEEPKRAIGDRREKSAKNISADSEGEISSRRLNASGALENGARTGDRPSRGASRTSKSLRQTVRISTNANAKDDSEEIFVESKRRLRETGDGTSVEEAMSVEERMEKLHGGDAEDGRTTFRSNENSRVSTNLTRNTIIEEAGGINEWTVPETQETPRKLLNRTKNSTIIQESMVAEEFLEDRENGGRSLSVSKVNLRDSKRRTRDATIAEASMEPDEFPENRTKDGRSVSKINMGDSKRRTRDATFAEATMEADEFAENRTKDGRSVSKINIGDSKRRTRDATIAEATMEADEFPGNRTKDGRSVSKINMVDSKRRTRDATIAEASMEADEFPGNRTKDGRSVSKINMGDSKRRTRDATIAEASMEPDEFPENRTKDGRSVSKINMVDSKRRTRDATIAEASMEADEFPGNRTKDGRSVSKINMGDSKRRTRDATIAEATMEADEFPGNRTKDGRSVSKINMGDSKRRTRDATIAEATMEADEFPGNRTKDGRSVSKINMGDSKRRTRDATIDEAPLEDDESFEFATRSLKSSTAIEDNNRDSKIREAANVRKTRSIRRSNLTGNSSRQLRQDWDTSESDDEHIEADPKRSTSSRRVSHDFLPPNKISSPSIGQFTRTKNSQTRKLDETNKQKDDHENSEKIQKMSDRSQKLQASRVLPDSAYELPDKERSGSLVVSSSDEGMVGARNPSNTSLRRSSRRDVGIDAKNRNSGDRSFVDEGTEISRKIMETLEIIANRGNSDESISETESPVARKTVSRKSIADRISLSHRQQQQQEDDSDQSISEELAISSPMTNSNSSQKNYRVDDKTIHEKSATSMKPSPQTDRNLSRKNYRVDDKIVSGKTSKDRSREIATETGENISDAETEMANNEISGTAEENVFAARREKLSSGGVSGRSEISRNRVESDESVDEDDSRPKDRSTNRPVAKTFGRSNVSKRRTEADGYAENLENENSRVENNEHSNFREATNNDGPSMSTVDESTTIPSESVPIAANLTKIPDTAKSRVRRSNAVAAQKNITDFFPSQFLKKRETSKTPVSLSSFDNEQLEEMRTEIETKRREMVATLIAESSKNKETTSAGGSKKISNRKNRVSKENTTKGKAKVPKVVDKAYIVNGQVYKRPRLPRPKPWVTDRLYRHLWKRMESKYGIKTRVKSEKFVEQLANVVALTIRRKKYESYENEVDALIKEMARLDIVKTRHDFYDFCHEYMPYDFRIKVTPMLHPGSIRIVPYDPATLDTPILPES